MNLFISQYRGGKSERIGFSSAVAVWRMSGRVGGSLRISHFSTVCLCRSFADWEERPRGEQSTVGINVRTVVHAQRYSSQDHSVLPRCKVAFVNAMDIITNRLNQISPANKNCCRFVDIWTYWIFRICDAMLVRYLLSSRVCPSVCLSQVGVVPKRLNIGSRDSPVLDRVIWPKGSLRNSDEMTPNRATNLGGVGKKFVSIRHGGPRPRRCAGGEYAVSSTTLVVVEVWWSQWRSC